jgi:predicted small metal-binding protein
MKVFRCADVVPGCPAELEGESDQEVLESAEAHARDEHGIDEVPPEIVDRIRAAITER